MTWQRFSPPVVILAISLLLFVGILLLKGTSGYWRDASVSIVIVLTLYYYKDKTHLTSSGFALVCGALVLHTLGGLGFYESPPISGIPWDIVTHLYGFFAVSFALSDIFARYLPRKYQPLLILLASLGVGSLVESAEYIGYLTFGKGEGFFAFGAGDVDGIIDPQNALYYVGGGYFDSMWDLLINLLGSLIGIFTWHISRKSTR